MDAPNILVVDDSSVIRRIVTRTLENIGARIIEAEDGQTGLEAALSEKFDLVISDVDMPRLDGFTLCKELKSHPATRGVPIIILSSLDDDKDIDRGFLAGAAAYIAKSEARAQLHETVERVLEKSRFQRDRLVLVVDDSPTILRLMKKGLEEAGFQVITAENGIEALKVFKGHRPDLILSDIDMPGMNGIDFCKAIHRDQDLASIPFVIMSASNDRAIMHRMLHLGATAYLVKPFNLDQVVITLEKLLSDHFLLLLKDRERLDTERKMMLASITSLVAALEARDHYTRGHSEAVAVLLADMASRMNADPEEVDSLTVAGRLHDLGKIGVPDSILLKPGTLTAAEFALVKEHPVVGANILGSIPSIKEVMPVILHHHERLDGKGYPDGLKGEQIPLWARMTAVADTYHALTSDRPYRKGMARDMALTIIEEVQGTQLCPECVNLFFHVIADLPENAIYPYPAWKHQAGANGGRHAGANSP
jgi:putative two-component system response regulator